jgi:DNA polymerase elongation subunit (family B)
MASDRRDIENEATYDGAFVATQVPGYYKYVSCFDFASMYPNLQIQFNISPDSYLGKYNPAQQVPDETIFTKNDTIFTNKFDSAARAILKGLYNERFETKAKIKSLEDELAHEKTN